MLSAPMFLDPTKKPKRSPSFWPKAFYLKPP